MSPRREQARRLVGHETVCRAVAVQRPRSMSENPTTYMPELPRRSVHETHDPTGEPGAGNRHAGFGEQGLET